MEWISTKDRLPEHNQEILLVTYDEEYQCPDDAPDWYRDEDGNPDHYPEKIGVYDGFFSTTGKGKSASSGWTNMEAPRRAEST